MQTGTCLCHTVAVSVRDTGGQISQH